MSMSDGNAPELKPVAVKIVVAQRLLADKARSEVYELISLGELDALKDGNRTLITTASIEKYMAGLPRAQMREPTRLAAARLARNRGRGRRQRTRKGAAA
jgi:hypothetical protein